MAYEVEKATIEDLYSINELYKQFPEDMSSNISNMERLFIDKKDDFILLVVKENEQVVGAGSAILFPSLVADCRPFLVIDNIIIDKDYQHRGLGTMLMNELENYAIVNKCLFTYLIVWSDNSVACDFYKKLGYSDPVTGFQKTYN